MPGFPSSGGEREPATVLSDKEVRTLRQKLVESILQYSEIADETITKTNRKRAQAQIWSTIDQEDAGILADIMIERGQSSPIAAQAVRGVIKTSKYVRAGIILAPRARDTFMFYLENGGILLWR